MAARPRECRRHDAAWCLFRRCQRPNDGARPDPQRLRTGDSGGELRTQGYHAPASAFQETCGADKVDPRERFRHLADLIVHSTTPYNAEPLLERLRAHVVTDSADVYVRRSSSTCRRSTSRRSDFRSSVAREHRCPFRWTTFARCFASTPTRPSCNAQANVGRRFAQPPPCLRRSLGKVARSATRSGLVSGSPMSSPPSVSRPIRRCTSPSRRGMNARSMGRRFAMARRFR